MCFARFILLLYSSIAGVVPVVTVIQTDTDLRDFLSRNG